MSGATASWEEGKGNKINYDHKDPTIQALEDFRSSIINNTNLYLTLIQVLLYPCSSNGN